MTRQLSRQVDGELAWTGLQITQYSLLKPVIESRPISPSEQPRRPGLDPSRLTPSPRLLVAAGWLGQTVRRDAFSRLVEVARERA